MKVDGTGIGIRAAIAAAITGIVGQFGYWPILFGLLLICMALDFATGFGKAVIKKQISSQRAGIGAMKKLMYLAAAACGLFVDAIITISAQVVNISVNIPPIIGMLTLIWLILTETISIVENISSSGVPVPLFLLNIAKYLKVVSEKAAEIKEEKKQ